MFIHICVLLEKTHFNSIGTHFINKSFATKSKTRASSILHFIRFIQFRFTVKVQRRLGQFVDTCERSLPGINPGEWNHFLISITGELSSPDTAAQTVLVIQVNNGTYGEILMQTREFRYVTRHASKRSSYKHHESFIEEETWKTEARKMRNISPTIDT